MVFVIGPFGLVVVITTVVMNIIIVVVVVVIAWGINRVFVAHSLAPERG